MQPRELLTYNPLGSIELPGAGSLDPSGLIVVIGPNSSGKTLFLRDVEKAIEVAKVEGMVVLKSVTLACPADWKPYYAALLQEKLIAPRQANSAQVVLQIPLLGRGANTPLPDYQLHELESAFNSFSYHPDASQGRNTGLLRMLAPILITSLFIPNRLILVNPTVSFDYNAQPPQNDLQTLYHNPSAKQQLEAETGRVFGHAVWLDNTGHGRYCIRVSHTPRPPAERHEPSVAERHRVIDEEGDGLKSYVGICIALLLGRRPVCLIDEPELCLHPPQAYQLGRFIGTHATSEYHSTFVATHSGHTLRGILDTAEKVTLVRLFRHKGTFNATVIQRSELTDLDRSPMARSEAILDGLFSKAVIIVESDGDRLVYQTAWHMVTDDIDKDVLFVPVSGTGGISVASKFYRNMNVPLVIIADLDVTTDISKLKVYLSHLTSDAEAQEVAILCSQMKAELLKIEPALGPQAVHEQLAGLANEVAQVKSWGDGYDTRLRGRLGKLCKDVSRISRLKKGGVAAFDAYPKVKELLQQIIERCRAVGVFLVPVGTLEGWCKEVGIGANPDEKALWANEAAVKIAVATDTKGDVWDFLRGIVKYIQSRESVKAG